MSFLSRLNLKQDPRVMPALEALLSDPEVDRRFVLDGGIFYATIGRDRRKLDMTFVEAIEKEAREVKRLGDDLRKLHGTAR